MNPKQRQDWIFNELAKDKNITRAIMYPFYIQNYPSLSFPTFKNDWKKALARAEKHHQAINDAIVKESIKGEVKLVKNGLKTKFQRIMILQKEVDEIEKQLETKKCNDTIVRDGEVKNIIRLMNQRELNDTRKTLHSLQAEISKIEGDYAPNKTEIEITDVEPAVWNFIDSEKK